MTDQPTEPDLRIQIAKLLGWTDIRADFEGPDGIGFGIPPGAPTGMLILDYEHNASDDLLVLEAIRDAEHDGCPIVDWEAFLDALYDETKVRGYRKYEAVAGYVVGAYSRAALAVKKDDPDSPEPTEDS